MSDYMDFAEAHAQKQLEQDERREAAIRADERAKCRAELRDVVAEVERIARDDYGSALDVLYDFTKEAFGGE